MAARIKTVALNFGPQADPRIEAKRFYDSAAWRRFKKVILARDAVCTICNDAPSSQVHHKIKRRIAPQLALSYDNCTGVCSDCHSRMSKSAN